MPPDDDASPEPNARVSQGALVGDRYKIVDQLGEGGMGTVLIAEHVDLARRVALKVLQEKIGDDPTMKKRFQREARTLAAMAHPNIVALNDYGIWRGTPYLVMELLAGRTLRDLLDEEKTLESGRAIAITQQVLRALGYAQAQGVIHRDLKPGNVFLQALPDHLDHVKLLDFGFAKFVGTSSSTSMVTGDGMLVGTPAYMAPEQATAGAVDHRADVYATGVLLFEMICGQRPFEGTAIEMLRNRLKHDAPSLHETRPDLAVAPELEHAVARALTRDPRERWQTAGDFAAALSTVPENAVAISAEAPKAAPIPESISVSVSAVHASKTMELTSGDLGQSDDITAWLAGRESAKPTLPAARTKLTPWIAGGAAVVVVLVAWYAWPTSETHEHHASAPPASREEREEAPPPEPRPEPPPEPVVEAAPVLPPDPWAADLPEELRALRARIQRGERPGTEDLQQVGAYARHHPDDIRAVLLLAHGYTRSHYVSGALERYAEAYDRAPESRGDPRMLEDLLALAVKSRVHGDRASELFVTIYGREALPAIDRGLAEATNDDLRDRLRALRGRIDSGP